MSSSINKKELEKFDKLSSSWWDKDGEFKILHQINPIRVNYIIDKIQEHFNLNDIKNINILDIGCGGGLASSALKSAGGRLTSIDASFNNIQVAKEHAKEINLDINFINTTIEDLAKTKETFDVVICLEVIEHINDPAEFIKNIKAVLNPNGLVVISTLNRTIKSRILAIGMAEYVLGWVPRRTHEFGKFLKPSEISQMAEKCNLNLKELKGLVYNPLLRAWQLSNEDISVNYFAVFY